MNHDPGRDPLERLRAANPVTTTELPPASLARLRARVREDVMSSTASTAGRDPRRLALAIAGLGALAALTVALSLLVGSRGAIAPTPGAFPGGGIASCVAQYSLQTLTERTFAFDGTVTAVDGDRATFSLNEAFRGVTGSSVTLDAPGMTGSAITSIGGPHLDVGARYLVAGDDSFAWACGFTQPYDAAVAGQWRAAFRR